MALHRLRKQGVEAVQLFFKESQPFQLQGQHLAMRRMRPPRDCFDEPLSRAAEAFVAQLGQVLSIGLTLRDGMQDAKTARTEQIGTDRQRRPTA